MDYSVAYVTRLQNSIVETKMIGTPDGKQKDETVADREGSEEGKMNFKFYNLLAEIVAICDEVIIYGPDDARWEFLHFLRSNYLFESIKISIKQVAAMSVEEQHVCFAQNFIKEQQN